jgi:hypothetical protein
VAAIAAGACLVGLVRGAAADDGRASATCPVTLPNREPPQAAALKAVPPIPPVWDGNGKLWVKLWPRGVMVATPATTAPDGSFAFKIPWWRATTGTLAITEVRLDAHAPRIRNALGAGYGLTGFEPSGIAFPTQGCWRVTGHVGRASLSFVTLVVTVAGNGYGG